MASLSWGETAFSKSYGKDTSDTTATDITPSATANTMGSWTEITSSLDYEANCGITVTISHAEVIGVATDEVDYLIDIGIGAAGDEQVIVQEMLSSRQLDSTGGWNIYHVPIPVGIAKGTRVSARCQANGIGQAPCGVIIHARTGGEACLGSRLTSYGANTSDSGGVAIDPGGTINTVGSWTEITSSTTHDTYAYFIMFGTSDNNAMSSFTWLFDLAIGPAGDEQIIQDGIMVASNGAEQLLGAVSDVVFRKIPKGTRLSMRAQCSGNNAADRVLDAVVCGVR